MTVFIFYTATKSPILSPKPQQFPACSSDHLKVTMCTVDKEKSHVHPPSGAIRTRMLSAVAYVKAAESTVHSSNFRDANRTQCDWGVPIQNTQLLPAVLAGVLLVLILGVQREDLNVVTDKYYYGGNILLKVNNIFKIKEASTIRRSISIEKRYLLRSDISRVHPKADCICIYVALLISKWIETWNLIDLQNQTRTFRRRISQN